MTRPRLCAAVVLAVLALPLVRAAAAGPPTDQLKGAIDRVVNMLDDPSLKKGDRWLVHDVTIEGVSLVSNYRTQFNKIIQTGSYTDLVQKLRTKHDELAAADQSPVGRRAIPVKK